MRRVKVPLVGSFCAGSFAQQCAERNRPYSDAAFIKKVAAREVA
jgi:hypothetical protein